MGDGESSCQHLQHFTLFRSHAIGVCMQASKASYLCLIRLTSLKKSSPFPPSSRELQQSCWKWHIPSQTNHLDVSFIHSFIHCYTCLKLLREHSQWFADPDTHAGMHWVAVGKPSNQAKRRKHSSVWMTGSPLDIVESSCHSQRTQ